MALRKSLIIVAILSLAASAAFAAAGAYVDNIQVTNNGKAFFTEDFNSNKLDNWRDVHDAETFCTDAISKDYALNLNKKGTQPAGAVRDLKMKVEGPVEFKARVTTTGPGMQMNYDRNMPCLLEFQLAGDGPSAMVRTIVLLKPKETSNRVGIYVQGEENGKQISASAGPKKPVLEPGVWGNLTTRMNPETKTVTMLLNDKEVASLQYKPEAFKEIRTLTITCTYGEGRDPSVILIPGRP